MKVVVNQENCIGCGMCEGICPEVFQVAGEDYVSSVVGKKNDLEENKEKVIEAKESCPTGAIVVTEEE